MLDVYLRSTNCWFCTGVLRIGVILRVMYEDFIFENDYDVLSLGASVLGLFGKFEFTRVEGLELVLISIG